MRRVLLFCLACAVAAVTGCSTGGERSGPRTEDGTDGRLSSVETWAFAVGDGSLDGSADEVCERWGGYDLLVIDAEDASPGVIAALQHSGTIVLGYMSVGTIEPWRSWYPQLRPYALDPMDDWDEYYTDISQAGCRTALLGIAAEQLDKGFDGLFLDNVDMIETHPGLADEMASVVGDLARITHDRGGLLFAQNGAPVLGDIVGSLDGWNREDVTWTYDFGTADYRRVEEREHRTALAEIERMRSRGLLVLSTDYTEGDRASLDECVQVAVGAGALPYVSDITLSRVPRPIEPLDAP